MRCLPLRVEVRIGSCFQLMRDCAKVGLELVGMGDVEGRGVFVGENDPRVDLAFDDIASSEVGDDGSDD